MGRLNGWHLATLALSSLLLACSQNAEGQKLQVRSPDYQLTLAGDWTEDLQTDPEMKAFLSRSRNASFVISSMSLNAKPDQTEIIARKLADFRMKAEGQVAQQFGLHLTITEPVIVQRPWGHAIAYYGSDNRGRQFSFSGLASPKATISIYVESATRSEAEVHAMLNTIIAGLEFDRTPIH